MLYRFAHPSGLVDQKYFDNDQDATQYALSSDDKLQAHQYKRIDGLWHRESDSESGWTYVSYVPELTK